MVCPDLPPVIAPLITLFWPPTIRPGSLARAPVRSTASSLSQWTFPGFRGGVMEMGGAPLCYGYNLCSPAPPEVKNCTLDTLNPHIPSLCVKPSGLLCRHDLGTRVLFLFFAVLHKTFPQNKLALRKQSPRLLCVSVYDEATANLVNLLALQRCFSPQSKNLQLKANTTLSRRSISMYTRAI